MEKTLEGKNQTKLRGWLAGGVIAGLIYIVATVFFTVFFNQAVTGVYDAASVVLNVIGAVADTFGTVAILTVIFFAGLLIKKDAGRFFIKFFMWAALIVSLYYVMPRFVDFYNIVEYNSTITALQTVHILCLLIPQMLFTASVLSYVIEMDRDNKKVTYALSWLSFLAAIGMFAVEAFFVGSQISAADRTLNIFYYSMDALGIFVLIFFSAVIHRASKVEKGKFFGV